MEPLTSALLVNIIGKPVSKFLFKQAFGDSVVMNVSTELLDSVATIFSEDKEKKKVAKTFEAMSQGITENLWPLFKNESEGTPRKAVALELADTINQFVNSCLLVETNLDENLLHDRLKSARPKQIAALGEAGQALYYRALKGIAPQLVAFAPQFDGFQVAAQGEVLQRLAVIISNLDYYINTPKEKGRLYRLGYLGVAYQCLDEMELFGADLPPGQKRHPLLSVAYVALSLTERNENTILDAESLLNSRVVPGSRLLISGDAGSGKSTLMRWLSLQAARYQLEIEKPASQRFLTDEETRRWNQSGSWRERVPFLLRLRDYATGQLPKPNDFALSLSPALDDPPSGWVKDILSEGQGIVIFDGIDEVPMVYRDRLQKGMEEYFREYPLTSFVLSARPAAIEDWTEWLETFRFNVARIKPMSNAEKTQIIARWHEAVRLAIPSHRIKKEELARIDKDEKILREKLFNDPNLSRLASYPLLCAVICALHHWKGNEPLKGYWRLCDSLCRLLINDRDIEAQLQLHEFPPCYAELDYEEKREIAQTIAMAMVEPEFKSSLDITTATKLTEPILKDVPGRKPSEAAQVIGCMGERSGILRVPREGDVEFIHNIFKEFLVADNLLNKERRLADLLEKTLDKDWAGVIVCASASPVRGVAADIVRKLLSTGQPVLALRCRAVAHYFDDDLEPVLQEVANSIFPPKDREEADAVATLGNAAVERLAYQDSWTSNQANACVIALGFINTDEARQVARTYLHDERVLDELCRVINPLTIPIVFESVTSGAERKNKSWLRQIVDITSLLEFPNLTNLDLNFTSVSDVRPLANLRNLRTIGLCDTNVNDVSSLAALPNLQDLFLSSYMKDKVRGTGSLKNKIRWY